MIAPAPRSGRPAPAVVIAEAFAMAMAAIRAHRLRAVLTVLGIVIGVATVTGMSAIVAGLNVSMARQIESLGTAILFVRPFGPTESLTPEEARRRKGLTEAEVAAMRQLPAVAAVAPFEVLMVESVKHGSQRLRGAQVFGATEEYAPVHDVEVVHGRFLSSADVSRAAQVAVLGAEAAEAVFAHTDALGKDLLVEGRRFRVVGVMGRKGKVLFQSQDNIVIVPLGTLTRRDSTLDFLMADLKAASPEQVETANEQVRELLRRKRRLHYRATDNFSVSTQEALTELYGSITGGIYALMVALSSIGLVVGGVGVMNIMLVSVTERTREIGVRMALGARRQDILWQFLTEAVALTVAGGGIGVLLGGVCVWLIDLVSPFPAAFQPGWVVASVLFSAVVGLVFGLWPASRAASLAPVEALRRT